MNQDTRLRRDDAPPQTRRPEPWNSALMMDLKPTEQAPEQYYDIRYDRWPEADAELAWVYESMRPQIFRFANEERARIQTIGDPEQRLAALKARRSSLVSGTTASKVRDHRATQYLVAGMAMLGVIPAMGVLSPDTVVIPEQVEQWIMIAALAVTLTCSLRCLSLVFEPWLSGRLGRPTPGILANPRAPVIVQLRHSVHWRRRFGIPLPIVQRHYRALPVTQTDLRFAALDVLQAEELERQR